MQKVTLFNSTTDAQKKLG